MGLSGTKHQALRHPEEGAKVLTRGADAEEASRVVGTLLSHSSCVHDFLEQLFGVAQFCEANVFCSLLISAPYEAMLSKRYQHRTINVGER